MSPTEQRGRVVAVELTNECNLRCAHCPQGILPARTGMMSPQTLLAALEHCEGYTELNWRGEPLLHPRLVEMVRHAKQFKPQLYLGFHTNALAMTRDLFLAVVAEKMDWMHVSLHSERSVRQYVEIRQWNRDLGEPIDLYGEVDNQQEELVALSLGLHTEDFRRGHLANWGGFLTQDRVIHPDAEKRAAACWFVQNDKFLVGWDGSVYPCCWDFQGVQRLGDVRELDRISHRPSYQLCPRCIWVLDGKDQH